MQRYFYKRFEGAQLPKSRDFDTQVRELEGILNFGTLEFDYEFGEIVNMTASDFLNAEDLKKWIDSKRAIGVKIVMVKNAVV